MKINPENSDEENDASTMDGMWMRIRRYSLYDPLRLAEYYGLTREETAILLSHEALKKAETLMDEKLSELQNSTSIIFLISDKKDKGDDYGNE